MLVSMVSFMLAAVIGFYSTKELYLTRTSSTLQTSAIITDADAAVRSLLLCRAFLVLLCSC